MRALPVLLILVALLQFGCAPDNSAYWRSVGLKEAPRWTDGRKVTPDEHRYCRDQCRFRRELAQSELEKQQRDEQARVVGERRKQAELARRQWVRDETARRVQYVNRNGIITRDELVWCAVGLTPRHTQTLVTPGLRTDIMYYGSTQFVFENNILVAVNDW